MKQDKLKTEQTKQLRGVAEEALRKRKASDSQKLSDLKAKELIHELEVHQIELEMQNEELRRTQAKVSEARDKYADLYDFSPIGYLTLDEKGDILEANLAVSSFLKVEMRYLIKKKFGLFVAPDFRNAVYAFLKQVFASKSKQTCEIKLFNSDGQSFHAYIESIQMEKTQSGGARICQTAVVDISERQRAEELLHESEKRYHKIVSTLTDYIYTVHIEKGQPKGTFYGPGCKTVTGYEPEEFLRDPYLWIKIAHEEDRRLVEEWSQSILEGKAQPLAHRVIRKDGSIRWVRDTPVIQVDISGKLIAYDGVVKDITDEIIAEQERVKIEILDREIIERKKLQETLEESEARFKALFNGSKDGILLADPETKRFYMWNKAICQMLGYAEEEIKRLDVNDIYPEKDLPYVMEPFDVQAHGEIKLAAGLPVKRKDGSIFYADINTSPILLARKKYLMGSFRDITERKKAEQAMQEAVKVKSEFTGMVSHELRTPLTAIKESISLVLEKIVGSINQEQEKYLGMAKNNVDRLARLINGVLDFQQLESGKMEFKIGENDINELVKQIREAMLPLAEKKNLNFRLQLDENLPHIRFDPDKITQVLTNLANNALKFTEKGGITIATSKGRNFIQVTVKDTGQGIKEEDILKLFQQFTQLQRKVGGTGLGLSIWSQSHF